VSFEIQSTPHSKLLLNFGFAFSIRELAHPTTKSSLIHTWTKDTRDDPWMGTSGSLLKLIHVGVFYLLLFLPRDGTDHAMYIGIRRFTWWFSICSFLQVDYAIPIVETALARIFLCQCARHDRYSFWDDGLITSDHSISRSLP
jgi:hypothetical protein